MNLKPRPRYVGTRVVEHGGTFGLCAKYTFRSPPGNSFSTLKSQVYVKNIKACA